jgi:hypothetical protein
VKTRGIRLSFCSLFVVGKGTPFFVGEDFADEGAGAEAVSIWGDEVFVGGRTAADEVVGAEDLIVFGDLAADLVVGRGDFVNRGDVVFVADEEGLLKASERGGEERSEWRFAETGTTGSGSAFCTAVLVSSAAARWASSLATRRASFCLASSKRSRAKRLCVFVGHWREGV